MRGHSLWLVKSCESSVFKVKMSLLCANFAQREHSALLSKLEFICDLVQCIVSVADERRSPLAQSLIINRSLSSRGSEMFVDEVQRCMEQLVLYVRALHLLASGLQLARCALRDGNLEPSKTASRSEFEYQLATFSADNN